MTLIVEPLDQPNGLIVGHVCDKQRFLTLLSYDLGGQPTHAVENVGGKNVGNNATTVRGAVFAKDRPSQVICQIRKKSIAVLVDGQVILSWEGDPSELSLGDYWKTPNEQALFLGAYDCRYRFSRITLTPVDSSKEEEKKK